MNIHDWLEVTALFLQFLALAASTGVAIYALRIVQKYTKEKDAADLMSRRWNEQAMVNIACLNDRSVLQAHEEVVYGDDYRIEEKESRKMFIIFTMLNQINHHYTAFKHGVMDKEEYLENARNTAKLLKTQEVMALYCLENRGYTSDFKKEMENILSDSRASPPKKYIKEH